MDDSCFQNVKEVVREVVIHVSEDAALAETEVTIRCRQIDDEVQRALALLRSLDNNRLTGERDGAVFLVDAADVLYFDSVDKKTFMYTNDDVLETPLRLYMLEERLGAGSFVRVSKNCILNLKKVASLKPEFGGRMEAKLAHGERLTVSRQYLPALKAKLGM